MWRKIIHMTKFFYWVLGRVQKWKTTSLLPLSGRGPRLRLSIFWPKNVLVYFENGKWKRVPLEVEGVHFLGCLATKTMTSCGIIKKRIKILRWAKDDKKTLQVSWIQAWVTIWHLESEMNKNNIKRRPLFRRKAKDDKKGQIGYKELGWGMILRLEKSLWRVAIFFLAGKP